MRNFYQFFLILPVCLFIFSCAHHAGGISPEDLKTEWRKNPLGVEVTQPGLSWKLTSQERAQRQTGYQILVATSEEHLADDKADVWNSGHVSSAEQINIIYKGPALLSGNRYYWKVRVWDKNNMPSGWSETAWWEMGLLNTSDWQGSWIAPPAQIPVPLLRKDFSISKKIKKATAYILGLGWYELYLNGSKVGDHVLTPANTNYSKRLLYDSYEVTSYLKDGGNAVGIWLAEGYGPTYSKYGWRWMESKRVIMQLNIEFTDETSTDVITDGTWKASTSPILSADIYNGETYDATQEKPRWDQFGYDESQWEKVEEVPAPSVKLHSNSSTPLQVVKLISPVTKFRTKSGSYIIDLGQNISGWIRLSIRGAVRDHRIVIRHAETLNPNGTLNTFSNRKAAATDSYICKGGSPIEMYEPRFTYHGFRYIEVSGYPVTPDTINVEGCVVHANFDVTGNFSCSDSLINKIHSNFQWTMLNNFVSIPTDNPVRDERTPCQMDENCIYEAAINNFDMQQYYKKWLDDIYGSTSNPDWSAGQVLGPWLLYCYYGDKRILKDYYPSAKKEVDYCIANAEKSGYWKNSFGDWCPAFTDGTYEHSFSEGEVVNTTLYYKITRLLSKMAGILGNREDSIQYAVKAGSILEEFNNRLFNKTTNLYGSGKQVTCIMPLYCGLVPDDRQDSVFNNLVKDLEGKSNGHFGTGIYGTSFLPDILCDYGRKDLAFTVLSQKTYPSFGDQIVNHNATTVWEQWGPVKSGREMEDYDHAMFAGADKTFYTRFGGTRPLTPGYKTIMIKPYLPDELAYVNSSVNTVYGKVTSNWKKSSDEYTHYITVPVNTMAIVYIPGNDPAKVFENEIVAAQARGVRYLKKEEGYLVYELESGEYFFLYGRRR